MNWSISRHFSEDLIFERCRLGCVIKANKQNLQKLSAKLSNSKANSFISFISSNYSACPQGKQQLKFLPDKRYLDYIHPPLHTWMILVCTGKPNQTQWLWGSIVQLHLLISIIWLVMHRKKRRTDELLTATSLQCIWGKKTEGEINLTTDNLL